MEPTRPDNRRSQIRTYDRSSSVVFLKTKEAFGGLSNMAGGFPLLVNGVRICTSEALYQACRFPHLPDVQGLIIAQRSPMTAKMKGKPYRHDSRRDWNRVRVNVMRWCLRVKLAQNWEFFSKLLLDTGDLPIVEQSRKDDFWGARPLDDRTLVGMNVLGRLLMELREFVKAEPEKNLRRVEPLLIPNFLLGGRPIEPVTGRTLERAESVVGAPVRQPRYREPEPTDIQLSLPAPKLTARPIREDPAEYAVRGGNIESYPVYKDSGVPWLEKVPEHWEVRALAQLGRLSKGRGGNKEDEVPAGVPCVRYGDLYTTHDYFVRASRSFVSKEKASEYTAIKFGDVLFAGSGETIDEIGKSAVNLMRADACCGGDVIVFRPERHSDARYMGYATGCHPAAAQKATMGRGITVMHIYGTRLKFLSLPLPPLLEQAAIVRFLDHADRRIRRYIRAKQKLIALLEEQKQAIIHQAVTGRIDVRTGQPYAVYKPSGMEWLGEVPEHWEISRVKTEFHCLNHRRLPLSGTERGEMSLRRYDYYGASGVIDKVDDYIFDDELLLIAEDGANLVLRNLPLAIIARSRFWVNNHAHVLKPKRGHLEFLASVMESLSYLRWISGAAQPKLTQDRLMSIAIAVPTREEQDRIVSFSARETSHLHIGIEHAEREIDLLREYRTRLIADLVTGKLDVREAAAGLPEVDPLAAENDLIDGADHDTGSQRTRWRHGEAEGRAVADVPVAERRGRGQRVG